MLGRENAMRKLLLIAAAWSAVAFGLAACNTVDGIGKDIKKAGESIEDASGKKK
jgi:predicted small secreted protein